MEDKNDAIRSIEIHCAHCGTWFRSPIGMGTMGTFDTSTLYGNQAQCPKCGKMTSCNKENMRVRTDVGGFRGDQT